jgi:hypothetical protein
MVNKALREIMQERSPSSFIPQDIVRSDSAQLNDFFIKAQS